MLVLDRLRYLNGTWADVTLDKVLTHFEHDSESARKHAIRLLIKVLRSGNKRDTHWRQRRILRDWLTNKT